MKLSEEMLIWPVAPYGEWCHDCDELLRNCVCNEPFDPDDLPPEAFMTGICGGTKMYACDCGGDICVCGLETIICEGCIDCIEY